MNDRPVRLGISLAPGYGGDAEAEEVAAATQRLRTELLDLDVDAVDLARTEPPPGSRAVDGVALGTLIVTLAQSQLLASVVDAVRTWLAGSHDRSVRLELGGDTLELTGVSTDEQRRLADEWLRRHQGP